MSSTNYHTQKSGQKPPKRSNNPTKSSSVPVDKGLDNFFRGTRYRTNEKLEDGESVKDGQ